MNKINMNDNFLDLLKPNLDDAQKDALRVQNNSVIAAGAGSGKTQVLANRYSWLIMTGQAKVDEILTLTFTNKAASEMYQRIYKSLTFFAEHEVDDKLTATNKKLAQEALNNFSQAHIQTLDSYCGGIVRQAANRYGIKPDFTTGSNEASRLIKDKAFSFALLHRDDKGINSFCDVGNIQDFSANVIANNIEYNTTLATPKNYFVTKLGVQRKIICDAFNHYVKGEAIADFLTDTETQTIPDAEGELERALDDNLDKGSDEYKKLIKKAIEAFNTLMSFESITEEDIKTNSPNYISNIQAYKNFSAAIYNCNLKKGAIKAVQSAVKVIREGILEKCTASIYQYLDQYESILNLNELLDEFLEEINTTKRTSGNLSFNDVTELALKILLEEEDIRNQEKSSFKKIMIDEFQDNNGKNRDLLYLLSLKDGVFEDEVNHKFKIVTDEAHPLSSLIVKRDEKGNIIEDLRQSDKLFFVGDEKQSIYMFRGAEVSVFNELTKDGENDLKSMTYNYRSSSELVESFNRIFKGGNGIFESNETEEKDYEAYYKMNAYKNKDNIKQPPAVLTEENVPIHIQILDKSFSKDARNENDDVLPNDDIVGYNIAKKIAELGKKENYQWSNIAILDRTRTKRNSITKYLSMFNIPYEVDQYDNIFEDGIINDFYNFFRLCVYPSDNKAYAVYLTCPLSGLCMSSLENIMAILNEYAHENNNIFDPFPEDSVTESKIKNAISESEYEKYINSKAFFNEYKTIALQQRITSTLTTLWHNKGYKYETLLSSQARLCQEHFDMIFEMGRIADDEGKGVSWFVDQLALLNDSWNHTAVDLDAKGVSYPLERQQAVQIMSIHKSKGLQFKHVFIQGCLAVEPKRDMSPTFFDEETGLSIKAVKGGNNFFYTKGHELAKNKDIAEFRRLIYVAITRAIEDVYIVGGVDFTSNKYPEFKLIENAVTKFYEVDSFTPRTFNKEAGFDFENLDIVTYKEITSSNDKTSTDYLRENTLKNCDEVMENATIINYEVHDIPHLSPSKLEETNETSKTEDMDAGEAFDNPDDLLLKGDFEATDFGTLAHAYLEAQCNGLDVETFEPQTSLFKSLEEKDIIKTKEKCIQYAHQFKECELGKALDKAKENNLFYKAEWGFSMWYEDSIFKGFIDLIFSNGDGTYTIVDYKSNTDIEPERYILQQHSYRTAASKLLNVDESKISLYLYYLKYNKIVEIK